MSYTHKLKCRVVSFTKSSPVSHQNSHPSSTYFFFFISFFLLPTSPFLSPLSPCSRPLPLPLWPHFISSLESQFITCNHTEVLILEAYESTSIQIWYCVCIFYPIYCPQCLYTSTVIQVCQTATKKPAQLGRYRKGVIFPARTVKILTLNWRWFFNTFLPPNGSTSNVDLSTLKCYIFLVLKCHVFQHFF